MQLKEIIVGKSTHYRNYRQTVQRIQLLKNILKKCELRQNNLLNCTCIHSPITRYFGSFDRGKNQIGSWRISCRHIGHFDLYLQKKGNMLVATQSRFRNVTYSTSLATQIPQNLWEHSGSILVTGFVRHTFDIK